MTIRDIDIMMRFRTDKQSQQQAVNDFQNLKNTAKQLLGITAITVAVKKAVGFVKECVTIASTVEEMQNKFDVVFEGCTEDVEKWADEFGKASGRSRNDLKTYVADLGNLLVGFGMTKEQSADLSEQMTKTAIDLASFSNIQEDVAVNAMSKAVMGETESAKTLGAVLNDYTRLESMRDLGIDGTFDKLDQLTKMQVNYNAIVMQSGPALEGMGDAIRSMDNGSYESNMRKYNAQVKDLKVMIGQFFMPVAKDILGYANQFIGKIQDFIRKFIEFADKLGGVNQVLKIFIAGLAGVFFAIKGKDLLKLITDFGSRIGTLGRSFVATTAKVMAFVAIFVLLYLLIDDFLAFMRGDNSMLGVMFEKAGIDADKFRQDIIGIWNNIKTILGAVWQGIKNVAIPIFQGLWSFIKSVFEGIAGVVQTVAPQFADFLDDLANGEVDTDKWVKVGETIAKIAAAIVGVVVGIKAVIGVIKTVKAVIGGVNAVISILSNPIGQVLVAILAVIVVVTLLRRNWDKIKQAFLDAWSAIKNAWGEVASFFSGIWESIKGVFGDIVSWFGEKFSAAWEAIKGVFSAVGEFFAGVWETITGLFSEIGTTISEAISGAVKGAINAVLSGAVRIINGFISAINFAIGVINLIPGVAINKLEPLEAPQLAQGGYVRPNRPMPVIVGDNPREGEIISPVSKMQQAMLSALNTFADDVNGFARGIVARGSGAELAALNNSVNDANGAQGNGAVLAAINTFVSDANGFVRGIVARGNSAALAAGATTNNKTINQTVNISNQFNGDRAGQQKSAEAMNRASNDATGQMARALAMT